MIFNANTIEWTVTIFIATNFNSLDTQEVIILSSKVP